jgi:hypothetical protein
MTPNIARQLIFRCIKDNIEIPPTHWDSLKDLMLEADLITVHSTKFFWWEVEVLHRQVVCLKCKTSAKTDHSLPSPFVLDCNKCWLDPKWIPTQFTKQLLLQVPRWQEKYQLDCIDFLRGNFL